MRRSRARDLRVAILVTLGFLCGDDDVNRFENGFGVQKIGLKQRENKTFA